MPANPSLSNRAAQSSNATPDPRWLGMEKEALYDTVTSMYLECFSDKDVAEELSRYLMSPVSPQDVLQIRIAASREARDSGRHETKLKWAFRFSELTMNNLVKEHMILEGKTNFLEAKLALAEEMDMLMKTNAPHAIWIAVNDALGRNNIPLNLIRDFVAYHESHVRFAAILADSSWRTNIGSETARLGVLAQVTKMYQIGGGDLSQWLAKTLSIRGQALEPKDIDFLVDYNVSALVPELLDEKALVKHAVKRNASIKKHAPLANAFEGDMDDLTVEQADEIIAGLRSRIVPNAAELQDMLNATEQQLKQRKTGREPFEKLRGVLADYLTLSDIDRFFDKQDARKALKIGVSESDRHNCVADLNALPTYQDAKQHVSYLFQNAAAKQALTNPLKRYFALRWGDKSHLTAPS